MSSRDRDDSPADWSYSRCYRLGKTDFKNEIKPTPYPEWSFDQRAMYHQGFDDAAREYICLGEFR